MFRRIELINHYEPNPPIYPEASHYKNGLMGISLIGVVDEAFMHLRGCPHTLPRNARFYFTEKGWNKLGRKVIANAQRLGQDYRVITIKETDAQVVWRDKHTGYEVAVQPKRKRK